MATHTFEPVQWKVQTLSKDLNNAVTLANNVNLDIPLHKSSITATNSPKNGFAEKDLATMIQVVEQ